MAPSRTSVDSQRIQSQIGVSISLARNLVASWLPPLTEEERKREAEQTKTSDKIALARRRPGAGLGAAVEQDETAQLTLEEAKIKRRLMQKDKKLKEHARDLLEAKSHMKHKSLLRQRDGNSSDEGDEDEAKRRKGQKKIKISKSAAKDKAATHSIRGFGR